MTRKNWTIVGVLVLMLIAAVLFTGPEEEGSLTRSAEPGGLLALVRMYQGMGVEVDEDAPGFGEDSGEVAFLPLDLRNPREARDVLGWVSDGGHLVLTDPTSAIAVRLMISRAPLVPGLDAPRTKTSDCVSPLVAGVDRLAVDVADLSLEPEAPAGVACFRSTTGAYAVVTEVGGGTVTTLGGLSALSNESLRSANNATFAMNLLRGEDEVEFASPVPTTAEAESFGLWESLPLPAKVALIHIGIAVLMFALVRGRRFGRPISEEPISPIPSRELVDASAHLYRAAGARHFAAHLLREASIRRLSRRFGVPRNDPRFVELLSQNAGMEEDDVRAILAGSTPANDDDLVFFGRRLEKFERDLVGGPRDEHI